MGLQSRQGLRRFDYNNPGPEPVKIAALKHRLLGAFYVDLEKMNFIADVPGADTRQSATGYSNNVPRKTLYPARETFNNGRQTGAHDFVEFNETIERGCGDL